MGFQKMINSHDVQLVNYLSVRPETRLPPANSWLTHYVMTGRILSNFLAMFAARWRACYVDWGLFLAMSRGRRGCFCLWPVMCGGGMVSALPALTPRWLPSPSLFWHRSCGFHRLHWTTVSAASVPGHRVYVNGISATKRAFTSSIGPGNGK